MGNDRLPCLVFINSWNEWAEGAHIEPDSRYGRRYLEAVRRVKAKEAIIPAELTDERLVDLIPQDVLVSSVNRIVLFLDQMVNAKQEISKVNAVRNGGPRGWSNAKSLEKSRLIIESISSSDLIKTASRNGARIVVRGWCFVDHGFEPKYNRLCALTFVAENAATSSLFHTWSVNTYKREDIKHHFGSEAEADAYGFQADVLLTGMPEGEYNLAMMEGSPEGFYAIKSNRYLIVMD